MYAAVRLHFCHIAHCADGHVPWTPSRTPHAAAFQVLRKHVEVVCFLIAALPQRGAADTTAHKGRVPTPTDRSDDTMSKTLTEALLEQTPSPKQAPNAFEYTYHVRYSEVGHRGLMTLPAVVNAFQDCSTFQSEVLGMGMAWLKHQERAWVLTSWHIVIERYPSLCEAITVGTFATHFRGIAAKRTFYLRDNAGRLIARADSTWAFINLATGHPCRPEPEHIEPYGTAEPLAMPEVPRRIQLPDTMCAGVPLTVGRGLIDTNEHVNNCQYVQMALDLLPAEATPHELRVAYHRAAVLGDEIHPRYAQEAARAVVSLEDATGSPFAVIEIQ